MCTSNFKNHLSEMVLGKKKFYAPSMIACAPWAFVFHLLSVVREFKGLNIAL